MVDDLESNGPRREPRFTAQLAEDLHKLIRYVLGDMRVDETSLAARRQFPELLDDALQRKRDAAQVAAREKVANRRFQRNVAIAGVIFGVIAALGSLAGVYFGTRAFAPAPTVIYQVPTPSPSSAKLP